MKKWCVIIDGAFILTGIWLDPLILKVIATVLAVLLSILVWISSDPIDAQKAWMRDRGWSLD